MKTDFKHLLNEVEEEARREGPGAEKALQDLRDHFAAETRRIRAGLKGRGKSSGS